MEEKKYTCARCNKHITRMVESCTYCLRDFYPKCASDKSYRIFDQNNELVPCPGPFEIHNLKPSGKKKFRRRRTLSGGYNKDEIELIKDISIDKNDDDSNNNNIDARSTDNMTRNITSNINESSYDDHRCIKIVINIISKMENINKINIEKIEETVKKYVRLEVINLIDVIKDNIHTEFASLINEMKGEINILKEQIKTTAASIDLTNNGVVGNEIHSSLNKSKYRHVNERIIVRQTTNKNDPRILDEITSKINVEKLAVGVNKIVSKPNGNVVIDLEREADKKTLSNEIRNTFGELYKISDIKKKNPLLKIVLSDINVFQIDNEIIRTNLYKQNKIKSLFTDAENINIKIIQKYLNKKGGTSIIVEVST